LRGDARESVCGIRSGGGDCAVHRQRGELRRSEHLGGWDEPVLRERLDGHLRRLRRDAFVHVSCAGMSFNVAVWHGPMPANNGAAKTQYLALYDTHVEQKRSKPIAEIKKFVTDLMKT